MSKNQKGFGHWAILLVVIVVAGVGVVGVKVYKHNHPSVATTVAVPAQIKSVSDLKTAQKALDSASLPDPNTLNNDLKSLL